MLTALPVLAGASIGFLDINFMPPAHPNLVVCMMGVHHGDGKLLLLSQDPESLERAEFE